MGINECSQSASKSSWDSQDFGDVNMVLKMAHFHKSSRPQWVKQPIAAWRRMYVSSLVPVMACCLLGAKPISESRQTKCRLDPWEQTSVNFESRLVNFDSIKSSVNVIWKCQPVCSDLNVLNQVKN